VTLFYDAVTPANIPEGAYACLYVDGDYAAPPPAWRRFARTRGITVLGGAAAAAQAGAGDFEAGNALFQPDRLTDWVAARHAMNCRARVYCDRANLPRAHALVGAAPNVVWWLSTLDNHEWSAAELLADVLAVEQIALEPSSLWAVQYAGGMNAPVDTNILFGDF
jgi:hypothetical protein